MSIRGNIKLAGEASTKYQMFLHESIDYPIALSFNTINHKE